MNPLETKLTEAIDLGRERDLVTMTVAEARSLLAHLQDQDEKLQQALTRLSGIGGRLGDTLVLVRQMERDLEG